MQLGIMLYETGRSEQFVAASLHRIHLRLQTAKCCEKKIKS